MGMLDGLLGQLAGNIDVANLASKVGLSEEQVEMAMTALGQAHTEPGDTVETAAANTGLSADVLQQVVGHIGGEGSLGRFAEMLQQGGEGGGIMGQLGGLASGLFGGNKA
ncbi:MAG: hypothetical protein V4530_12615 [Pseudomonadota bacterium]